MELISRPSYMDTLLTLKKIPDIKVITGIRRCGKSSLLELFIAHVEQTEPKANIIHINLVQKENEHLLNAQALYEFIEGQYKKGCENIVCIDEIQMCEDFEKAVSWLYESRKYNIYITGSNAFLLSGDLATLFTGRSFEIEVYPFSLSEFMDYFSLSDANEALDRYIRFGGMAGAYPLDNAALQARYINSVFTTLIIRDIQTKYHIRDMPLLQKITDYLLDNIANLTSVRNITAALSIESAASNNTVSAYIQHLCNAYLFYRVRRYDIAGKKYLATQDKYYLCDHSFRYARLGTKNMDYGRTLENIVALELMRRGYEVYVGVLYKKEIDFVAVRQHEKIYIQVAEDISSPETFQRECEPLEKIRDSYPKMILARTRHETYDYEGIKICDAAEWLCNRE
ncbi:MAG TPA: ATP-binding protein [Methanocorpusculum sp.]|nr:ATP-binding protein [Methanocorpusculum sp.]